MRCGDARCDCSGPIDLLAPSHPDSLDGEWRHRHSQPSSLAYHTYRTHEHQRGRGGQLPTDRLHSPHSARHVAVDAAASVHMRRVLLVPFICRFSSPHCAAFHGTRLSDVAFQHAPIEFGFIHILQRRSRVLRIDELNEPESTMFLCRSRQIHTPTSSEVSTEMVRIDA
jgi:hypothetical protein